MENQDTRKYNYMENVLQNINKKYISLPEDEVKRNNLVLEAVLSAIIAKMKEKNVLFKSLFERVFYGGSYFDGLKVGNPDEFDLDLLFALPKYAKPEITVSNIPGFMHVQLKEWDKYAKQPEATNYRGLLEMMDSKHYLGTSKVSAWIEGLVCKVLNDFPKDATTSASIIKTSKGSLQVKVHKGGPAHTLKLQGNIGGKNVIMDVDLVPCFVFNINMWPVNGPKLGNQDVFKSKPTFFIVPKKPSKSGDVERYWRLSFQEQERILINNSKNLKPALKLLKKLRDSLNAKVIASYYIKTLFLWELYNNSTIWNHSMSFVFISMLKKLQEAVEKKEIKYYWNKNNNLLDTNKTQTLHDLSCKLKKIVQRIETNINPSDEFLVANMLLTASQVNELKLVEKFQALEIIN